MYCEKCGSLELKIGDVVKLKSGGPNMTVQILNGNNISCSYFTGSTEHGNYCLQSVNIASDKCLELVKD